jgi:protoporphyrinogen oxidase
MDVGVIGAGPAGLALAAETSRAGLPTTVYERSSRVGGLARSFDLFGHRVDLGSHILATSPVVHEYLGELLHGSTHEVPLRRGVVIDGTCYAYPFQPVNVLTKSGVRTLARLGAGYARGSRRRGGAAGSAEAWIVDRYGWAFHDRFFRPYTEKLWGVPASQVDERLARVITGSANDTSSDGSWARLAKRLRPAPSDRGRKGTFTYPDRGIGEICDRLADRVVAAGGTIRTDVPVSAVVLEDDRVAGVATQEDGNVRPHDHVVAAVPVPVLLGLTGGALGSNPPRTRATIVVYVEVAAEPAFDELWRFLCDPDLVVGRVANLSRWTSEAKTGGHLLACEVWCDPDDGVWSMDEDGLTDRVLADLARAGIVPTGSSRRTHVERVAATHVVPAIGAAQEAQKLEERLAGIEGLSVAGRGAGLQSVGAALASGLQVASELVDRARQAQGDGVARRA